MKQLRATCAMSVVFLLATGSMLWGQAESADTSAGISEETGLSVELSLTVPTAYVFRGYVEEDDHALFQPEMILSYGTQIGDIKFTPYLGVWANLTDAPRPGDPEWFDEIDVYVGAEFPLPCDLTLGVIYTWYTSPADTFDDIHEIGVSLAHDDFLNPAVGVYREIENKGEDENTYIELRLTPGFDMPKVEKLRLDFPLVLGLTPDDYYTDDDGDSETIGYASAGVTATYAFNDAWSVETGVDYFQLTADSTEESNDGDDSQVVGWISVIYTH